MVQLIKNGDWKSWALSVAILIIAGLAGVFSALSLTLIKDFRSEVLLEFRDIQKKNHEQDLCLKELQTYQGERLRREGKK